MKDLDTVVAVLARERGPALVGYAYLLTGELREAEDLVQEAFIRTLAKSRGGTDLWAAEQYVRKAVLTLYLDGYRRSRRWRAVRHLVAEIDDHRSPVASSVARIDVRDALEGLPRRQRACVILRFYDDLTVPEIARRLGVSDGAVKRYLSDGLGKLRSVLGPDALGRADAAIHDDELVVHMKGRTW